VTAVCVLANVEQPLPEAANEWVAELAKEAESRGGVIVVPPKRANPRRWEFTIVRFADRHAAVIDAIEIRNRGVRVAVVGIATRMAAADDRIAVDRAMREAVTAARTMAATAQGGEIVLD